MTAQGQRSLFGVGPGLIILNMGAGRDSLAMLCRLTTEGLVAQGRRLQPKDIDAVVFSDSGAEWQHTYEIVPRIARLCAENGLRFIVLRKPSEEVWGPWVETQRAARLGARDRGEAYRSAEVPWAYTGATIEERAEQGGYHLRPPIHADFGSKDTIATRSDASCTGHHKIYPIRRFMEDLAKERFGEWASNGAWGRAVERGERRKHLNLVGFAADEEDRWGAEGGCYTVGYAEEAYPLVEDGIAKADEEGILVACDLQDARKSGCWLCPHQPTGWFWALRESDPATWAIVVEYERRAIERSGVKMAIQGRAPIAENVERWRARNPDATVAEVLSKTYAKCATKHAPTANPLEQCSLDDQRLARAWEALGLEMWAERARARVLRRNEGARPPRSAPSLVGVQQLAQRAGLPALARWVQTEVGALQDAWAAAQGRDRRPATVEGSERIVVLSMGAGRDSVAMLALLVGEGLLAQGKRLRPDDVDAVVFADTGAEWKHTYEVLPEVARICAENGLRFIVLRKPPEDVWGPWVETQRGARVAAQGRGERYRAAEAPWAYTGATIEERAEQGGYHLRPPILEDYAWKDTIAARSDKSCTGNHKVLPIRRLIEDLAKERFGEWANNGAWGRAVDRGLRPPHLDLVGIAADEKDRLAKGGDAGCFHVGYLTEAYPLVEAGVAKADEEPILARVGLAHVAKSGCYLCPFQPIGWYWALRETDPNRFRAVVDYEARAIARGGLAMAVKGGHALPELVDAWRARNPDATVAEVLAKTYNKCSTSHSPRANPWERCSLDDQRLAQAWVGLGLEGWAAAQRGPRLRRNDGGAGPPDPGEVVVGALQDFAARAGEEALSAWLSRDAGELAQAWAHAIAPAHGRGLPAQDLPAALPALDGLVGGYRAARAVLSDRRKEMNNPRWWPEKGDPVRDAIDLKEAGLHTWTGANLGNINRFIIGFSGGKDSIALFLHLVELGVPRDRIELWHHKVDGEGPNYFDWPCTEAYCRAFARAFGVPLLMSWREGGFRREMYRENAPTAPVHFFTPEGREWVVGGDSPQLGTRRMFPQTTADLRVRWCSSVLKIDVGARVFSNDPRFNTGRGLFAMLTGERAQESAARSRYARVEPHRTWSGKRRVLHWRAVHTWPEADIWEIIRRWRVNPHPAYRLGFSRLSCRDCIFGSNDQWATINEIDPQGLRLVADDERTFGKTIHRKMSVEERAAKGKSFIPPGMEALAAASQTERFDEPIIVRAWSLPAGAFRETGGPT